jgi:hypothetical protein
VTSSTMGEDLQPFFHSENKAEGSELGLAQLGQENMKVAVAQALHSQLRTIQATDKHPHNLAISHLKSLE